VDRALWAALVLAGLAAVFVPHWLLEVSPPCLFTALLGVECWGCGLTRATVAALHGQLALAWSLNPRIVVVLPLLGMLFVQFTRRAWPSPLSHLR
jgi:hypothetical protein